MKIPSGEIGPRRISRVACAEPQVQCIPCTRNPQSHRQPRCCAKIALGGKGFPRCSSPGQVIGIHSKRRRRGSLHHVAINKTAQTHWKSHNEWIKSLRVVLQSVKCHSPQKYISETLVSSGDERKGRRSFGSRHPQLQLNASQNQPTQC